MNNQAFDLVLVSDEKKEKASLSEIAKQFDYSLQCIDTMDALLESESTASLLIVSKFSSNTETSVDEFVQLTRQKFQSSLILVIVDEVLTKERIEFLKKLGARVVMMASEFFTAKLSFVINQYLRASYIPLKPFELIPENQIPFSVFHLMPSRKKFLPLSHSGMSLDTERLDKFKKATELYVSRKEILDYKKYIDEVTDKSLKGMAQRCRANFRALQAEFANLVIEITDQTNRVLLGDGKSLMDRCQSLCEDLLNNLAEFPNAWEIINNSSIGEFGSLERAPAVAAYSGLFGLNAELENVPEIMLASLFVDIGILRLPESIAAKIRQGQQLSAEEFAEYKLVPQMSLDMALSRKISISEKLRSIMFGVYERADGKGFPAGANHEKIIIESQVIALAKNFDARTAIKLGEFKKDPKYAMAAIFNDSQSQGAFSEDFIALAKAKLINLSH